MIAIGRSRSVRAEMLRRVTTAAAPSEPDEQGRPQHLHVGARARDRQARLDVALMVGELGELGAAFLVALTAGEHQRQQEQPGGGSHPKAPLM